MNVEGQPPEFRENAWYNTAEAAALLRVSTRYVQRLVSEGRIRATRVGPRRTIITGADLARFLEENRR